MSTHYLIVTWYCNGYIIIRGIECECIIIQIKIIIIHRIYLTCMAAIRDEDEHTRSGPSRPSSSSSYTRRCYLLLLCAAVGETRKRHDGAMVRVRGKRLRESHNNNNVSSSSVSQTIAWWKRISTRPAIKYCYTTDRLIRCLMDRTREQSPPPSYKVQAPITHTAEGLRKT